MEARPWDEIKKKEPVLWGTNTWSEMGKQNVQAKNGHSTHSYLFLPFIVTYTISNFFYITTAMVFIFLYLQRSHFPYSIFTFYYSYQFQLFLVLNCKVLEWPRKAVPLDILVTGNIYVLHCKINLASFAQIPFTGFKYTWLKKRCRLKGWAINYEIRGLYGYKYVMNRPIIHTWLRGLGSKTTEVTSRRNNE